MGTELRSRSRAARLSLGLGLGILAWGKKKKREGSVFGAGMEAGLSPRPALQLGCGRAPGSPSVLASWFTCCSARPPLPCLL